MLNELINIHTYVLSTAENRIRRYLYDQINWQNQAICIVGTRGVGKTTLMLQHLLAEYQSVSEALYISADNIHVLASGLFDSAQNYFSQGGKILFIDEVHKYPNWSIEIKNIIDTFKKCKVVFSGSSSIDLLQSKGDLSRRVVYYDLKGLSFREYLQFTHDKKLPTFTLIDIVNQHVSLAQNISCKPILKYFKEYLQFGYYPYFLEGTQDYLLKVDNVIEKVIWEDIAAIHNLKQTTLPIIKKLLWLTATSNGFKPNIDKISKNLQVSREVIYNCLEYIANSGLIINLMEEATGMKLIRKPGKIFLDNTNLLHAINKKLQIETNEGNIRETFFVNQLAANHRVNLHDQADFIINSKLIFEIGGAGKTKKQIQDLGNDAYLALDNIEIGFGKRIPLYLFGFLY